MANRDEERPVIPDPGDSVSPDLAAGVGAEGLDEDRLGLDPLEEGMDPSERWSPASRTGESGRGSRERATLDERLAEEEPESRPADLEADVIGLEERRARRATRGRSADNARGSVARALRAPASGPAEGGDGPAEGGDGPGEGGDGPGEKKPKKTP